MIAESIKEMLNREPFTPFRVVTSSGEAYRIANPALVTLMRSEVFIAQPNLDRWSIIPLLHVSAVETTTNGRSSRKPKRRGR